MSASRPASSHALSPLIGGCLAATWLIWGSTYLVIRFALVGFAPFFLMATRFLCAGALFLAWQLARGARPPTLREWVNASAVGTLMIGGGMGCTAYAELLAVGVAGVLMLTQGAASRASPLGLSAIMIGCAGWSLGSVLCQRGLTLAPGGTGFASEMLCGSAALFLISALRGESWHWPTTPGPLWSWFYLVGFGTLIAFSAYMILLARRSPAR